MKEVFEDIKKERDKQDSKWGVQEHHPAIWLMIAQEEMGEVSQAIQREVLGWGKPSDKSNLYEEVIQTAAVLVAFAEQLKNEKN